MTGLSEDDDRLAILLRAIPPLEPRADFLAGTRRRYLEALEARYRREVFTGLVAAAIGFGLAATLLLSVFEAATLIARVSVAMATLARWMDGIAIVLSCVPPLFWASNVFGFVVSLMAIASLARARSLVSVK